MQRKTRRIIIGVALIAALLAGGAAFTASNTLPSYDQAGYGNIQVSGATVTDIHNVLSTDGQSINEVDLTFSAIPDPTHATVVAGFGPTQGTAPTNLNITCTLNAGGTTATCGNATSAPLGQSTASANDFAVAVSH